MSENQDNKPGLPRRGLPNRQGKKPPLPRYKRGPFSYLIIAIAIFMVMMMLQQWQRVDKITLDEFKQHLKDGHIESVIVKDTEITGQFTEEFFNSRQGESKKSFVANYNSNVQGERIGQWLEESGIKEESAPQRIWLIMLMQWVLPLVLLIGFFYFFFARNLRSGAGGMLMSFGRSKHRLQGKDKAKVTFEDVAGVE